MAKQAPKPAPALVRAPLDLKKVYKGADGHYYIRKEKN